jgi:hypothetical protein
MLIYPGGSGRDARLPLLRFIFLLKFSFPPSIALDLLLTYLSFMVLRAFEWVNFRASAACR